MLFEFVCGVLVVALGGLGLYLYVNLKVARRDVKTLTERHESATVRYEAEIEALKTAESNATNVANIKSDVAKVAISDNELLTKQLASERENYAKLINQKKSSEVRLGQIGEHLAPFLTDWPWDSKNFRFLGNPVDGIQFNDDEVIFVEIKTGKSQLSKNQRVVRDLIKIGRVKWAEFRIGKDECSTKIIERIRDDEGES
jgi:predicted Holliday junction resolvase-like endonuclease